MKKIHYAIFASAFITGCAGTNSDPAYVSAAQYQDYNCRQISAEMQRVSRKIDQGSQTEETQQVVNGALAAFAISQGYGYSDDGNVEMQRLRNQYDVLEQTAIKKDCTKP